MPKDSCIEHVKGFYLEMRRDYVELFDGDHCSAALAAFFEWATTNEKARMRMAQETGEPWIKVSMPKLFDETVGLYSIRALQDRLDFFQENALVLVDDKAGTIRRYLLNISLINRLLSVGTVLRVLDRKNCHPGKIAGPEKLPMVFPNHPGKIADGFSGVEGVYKEVSLISLNQQSKESPKVPLEERLTPDVDTVHLTDFEDIELPDEPAKSKKQTWESGDRSKFWGQWKRKAKKPPTARVLQGESLAGVQRPRAGDHGDQRLRVPEIRFHVHR